MVRASFLALPQAGTPDQRQVALVVNENKRGKTNNVGDVTITSTGAAGQAWTLYEPLASEQSHVALHSNTRGVKVDDFFIECQREQIVLSLHDPAAIPTWSTAELRYTVTG